MKKTIKTKFDFGTVGKKILGWLSKIKLPRGRDALSVLVFALLALLCSAQLFRLGAAIAASGADCIDWGLSFPSDGASPIGNSDSEYLRGLNACYLGDTSEKVIYLTFDAGYENGYTSGLLDTLKEKNIPAAFFLVGHYVTENPQLVNRMFAEGHLVCSHTMNHPDTTKLTAAAFLEELELLSALVSETTDGKISPYYRPPSGKYNEMTLKTAQEAGYKTVLWSLAYADWDNERQPSAKTAYEKLLPRLHNGCILLLHATSKTNSEILGELIDKIIAAGYRFAPLTELK